MARQHAGITGQAENCQTVVFCSYLTARGHAPYDFRRYLPKAWCADKQRRERAKVPEDIGFKTKTELGAVMVTDAISAGVPFGFLAGDEVYGRSSKLRAACEQGGKAYVLAVPGDFRVRLHPRRGKARADTAARLVPAAAWETRSCGRGCKGHRDYHWAWLNVNVECHQQAKGQAAWTSTRSGSGSPSTATPCCPCAPSRSWPSPPPARLTPGAAADDAVQDAAVAQPAGWADTGILPASPVQPPPKTPAWSTSASPKPTA